MAKTIDTDVLLKSKSNSNPNSNSHKRHGNSISTTTTIIINALKCESLACSAFLKQRSRNSEHAQI